LSHESCNEHTFRNVSLTEEIRGLVLKKYGLPEGYLASLEDPENGDLEDL